jgi:hypothetical protein
MMEIQYWVASVAAHFRFYYPIKSLSFQRRLENSFLSSFASCLDFGFELYFVPGLLFLPVGPHGPVGPITQGPFVRKYWGPPLIFHYV